jgi:hypothetical protein
VKVGQAEAKIKDLTARYLQLRGSSSSKSPSGSPTSPSPSPSGKTSSSR